MELSSFHFVKIGCLLAIWFSSQPDLVAQERSPVNSVILNSPQIQIVPLSSRGLLILDFQPLKLNEQQLGFQIVYYGAQLETTWMNVLPITRGLRLQTAQDRINRNAMDILRYRDWSLLVN